jgi:hypothetical protein
MRRISVLFVFLFLFPAALAAAEPTEGEASAGAKELSGMSIVGNDEAPKSLYIVPWKSSEVGVETTLDTKLNENDAPVDRDVFRRQLGFYRARGGR